jgi:hypothetical protein
MALVSDAGHAVAEELKALRNFVEAVRGVRTFVTVDKYAARENTISMLDKAITALLVTEIKS